MMKRACLGLDSFPDASMVNVKNMNKKNLVLKMLLYAASFSSSESDIPLVYAIIEPVLTGALQ